MRTTASNTLCHLSSLQNDWQIFCRHAIITLLLLWLQFSSPPKQPACLVFTWLLADSVVAGRLDVLQAVGLEAQDARLGVQQPQVLLVNVPQDLSLDVRPLDDLLQLLLLLLLDVVPLLRLEDVEVSPAVVLDTLGLPAGLGRAALLLVVNVNIEALSVDEIVPAPVTGNIPDMNHIPQRVSSDVVS